MERKRELERNVTKQTQTAKVTSDKTHDAEVKTHDAEVKKVEHVKQEKFEKEMTEKTPIPIAPLAKGSPKPKQAKLKNKMPAKGKSINTKLNPKSKVPCPECGNMYSDKYLPVHRREKHGADIRRGRPPSTPTPAYGCGQSDPRLRLRSKTPPSGVH